MSVTQNEDGKGGCIAQSTVHFNNVISYPDSINIEYNHQDTVYYDHCCLWTTQHLRLQGKVYINNCMWDPGNTVIESNILSADPLFDFYSYYPYPYLQSGSPCIDAGSGTYGIPYDLFGLPRHVGNDVDMGAMEYQGE